MKEGIFTAFFMVLRITMLIMGTFLLTYTTSPIALTDGMEALLGPLKRVRVPVHELPLYISFKAIFFIRCSFYSPNRASTSTPASTAA